MRRLARPELVLAAFGALLLGVTFLPRLRGEYVWDDVYYVRDNVALQQGSLRAMFTQAMWGTAAPTPAQFYRPVPMLTLWLQAHVTGMSLPAFRAGNLVLHAACGGLLVAWLRKQGVGAWIAVVTGLAFLVHPSVTESVLWVMGRHDLMATAFTLTALLVWPAEDGGHRVRKALVASVCGGLAFLSKEPFAFVPALLAMQHVYGRWRAGLPLRDRGLALLAGPVVAALAVVGIRAAAGVSTSSSAVSASLAALARAYATVLAHYTHQLATWSNGMTAESWVLQLDDAVVTTLFVLAAAFAALAVAVRRGSMPAAGALLGVGMFALVLSPLVLALPFTGMFGNRYAYFPLVCAFVVLAHGAEWVAPRVVGAAPRLVPVVMGAAGIAVVLSAVSTAAEAALWRDPVTLFGADVERAPRDAKALYHYAHAVGRARGCGDAAPLYQRAVESDPSYLRAWHNLAGCMINLRRFDVAVIASERALELSQGAARDEYNLGVALVGARRKIDGLAHLERAVELEPDFQPARAALASARAQP
ncbi:MAG: yrrB 5 [Labilithrix sp.]|nr:yrrB 5 [Labilithrix sp.]